MKRLGLVLCLTVMAVTSILFSSVAVAQQDSSSTNYELDEVFIGPGGTRDSSSTNYNVEGIVGDIGAGERASGGYNLLAGFTTDAEPTLVFVVNSASIDLGELTTGSTATANGSFSVGAYNTDNIVVQTLSEPPTNNDYTLTPLTSATTAQSGAEQFGMNLRANTDPATFGTDPIQVPDSSFSFADATNGYGIVNQYKYNQGDVIAQSTQSSGQTDFTISYIFNVDNVTPGGAYNFRHNLVATSTY